MKKYSGLFEYRGKGEWTRKRGQDEDEQCLLNSRLLFLNTLHDVVINRVENFLSSARSSFLSSSDLARCLRCRLRPCLFWICF